MAATDVARNYFAAWNRHDPAGIVATFVEGGLYCDPAAPSGLTGPAIAEYTRRLFAAVPDATFEIVSLDALDENRVAAQWRMRGTSAEGRAIDLPGADFIRVDGNAVRSVQGYFDRRTLNKQLGRDK